MQKLKKAYESAPAWAFGPSGPCTFRFKFSLSQRQSPIWTRQFRLVSKSPDYKYVPYDIRKRRTSSRLATTILGAPPPLILWFHPSQRHAALITFCDQGSIVLTFTLVLLVLKCFYGEQCQLSWYSQHDLQQIYQALVVYHLRISWYLCVITY